MILIGVLFRSGCLQVAVTTDQIQTLDQAGGMANGLDPADDRFVNQAQGQT
jgi:hypothetical protein